MSAGEGDAGRKRPRAGRANGAPAGDGAPPARRKRVAAKAKAKANGAPAKRAADGRTRRPRPEEIAQLADEPAVALDAEPAEPAEAELDADADAAAAEAELDAEPADVAAFFGEDTREEELLATDAQAGDGAAAAGGEQPAEPAAGPGEVELLPDAGEPEPAADAQARPGEEEPGKEGPAGGPRTSVLPERPASDRYRVPTPVRPVPNPRRPRKGAGLGANARWLGREFAYRTRLAGYGLWRAAHWLGEHRGISAALVGIAISLIVTWIRFSERYDDFIVTALDSWPWAVLLFAINAALTVLLIRLFTRLVDAQRTIGYAVIVAIGFQGIIASDIKLEPIAGNDVPGQEPLNVGRLYEPVEGHISSRIDDDVNAARDGEIRELAAAWRGPRGPRGLTQTIAGMVETSVMDAEDRTEVTEGMAQVLGRDGPCAPAERVRRIGVLLYGNSARNFVQEAIRRAPPAVAGDLAAAEERATRRCEQRRAAARRAQAKATRRRAARQARADRAAATRTRRPAPGPATPPAEPANEAGL